MNNYSEYIQQVRGLNNKISYGSDMHYSQYSSELLNQNPYGQVQGEHFIYNYSPSIYYPAYPSNYAMYSYPQPYTNYPGILNINFR